MVYQVVYRTAEVSEGSLPLYHYSERMTYVSCTNDTLKLSLEELPLNDWRKSLNRTKVIFLDVDGTVADNKHRVPESAVEAISAAAAGGHRIYLCTGRSKTERCDEILELTGAEGLICSYGAYVEACGEILFHKTIDAELCREICTYFENNGIEFYTETCSGVFASKKLLEIGAPIFAAYQGREYAAERAEEYIGIFFPKMQYGGPVVCEGVEKINYAIQKGSLFNRVREAFPQLTHGSWNGYAQDNTFGDIIPQGLSKADGIDAILKHIGRGAEDAIAFGDTDNDIHMFKKAGFGVAMGNGTAGAKAAADYVTDSVNSDGLYKAFKHLELI